MTTLRRMTAAVCLATTVTGLTLASLPTPASSYALLGGSLGLSQRDYRVFDNFTDASANNNTNPHPNFPGSTGAVMAIRKGSVEWGSGAYAGNGLGDGVSSNSVLGSGGANFDMIYQGEATSAGNTNANVHSELGGCSGSTLAFMQGPISDGWTIKYYQCWTWQDGPGSNGSSDLQGVATHEIGHALGLDHSGSSSATMYFAISGSGVAARSITSDDTSGVQAIYGVKSASKPEITALSGSKNVGETLTIEGTGFSPADNEVWFTSLAANGNPLKLFGVSSSAGGTRIDVNIPAGVADGEVMVRRDANGNTALSNGFPIDVGTGSASPPFISTVTPDSGVPGGFDTVILSGFGFDDTTSVTFDGVEAREFTVVSDNEISAVTPNGSANSNVDVVVTDTDGTSTLVAGYFYSFNNPPDVSNVTPGTGSEAGGTLVSVTGPNMVGVATITFGGVPATGVEVLSPTEAQCLTPAGTGTVDVKVTVSDGILFFDSDTLPGGFDYQPGSTGAFVTYGTGSGGAAGVPVLDGSGDLTPGSATGFTLTVDDALAFAPATLDVGAAEASLTLKGQTLYLFPILLQIPLGSVAGNGTISLPSTVPAGTPTASLYLQVWIQDATGNGGFSSTNGLRLDIP